MLLLPKKDFHQLLDQSTEFRALVFDGFSKRLSDVIRRTTELATRSIDQRLAATLLAKARDSNNVFKVTHEELAIEVGTAREVISRRLSSYEKRGLLRKQRGQIAVLDTDALCNFCN